MTGECLLACFIACFIALIRFVYYQTKRGTYDHSIKWSMWVMGARLQKPAIQGGRTWGGATLFSLLLSAKGVGWVCLFPRHCCDADMPGSNAQGVNDSCSFIDTAAEEGPVWFRFENKAGRAMYVCLVFSPFLPCLLSCFFYCFFCFLFFPFKMLLFLLVLLLLNLLLSDYYLVP